MSVARAPAGAGPGHAPGQPAAARSQEPVGLDWATAVAAGVFQIGVYLDGWAHTHRPDLESFLTPWHAVLYGGFLAVATVTLQAAYRGRRPGRRWVESLPPGYGPSLLGVGLFAAGGLADLAWHQWFGIEADVDALLSPPHLLLALGAVLFGAGPLRAAWRRAGEVVRPWRHDVPAMLSLGYTLSALTFFTQYAHPLARPWAARGNRPTSAWFPVEAADPLFQGGGVGSAFVAQALGVAGILLQAALLAGLVLLALVRSGGRLRPGSLTVALGLNALAMSLMRDQTALAPAAIAAGLVGDGLLAGLRPTPRRVLALRLFAFALPAVYHGFLLLAIALTRGLWWPPALWTGAILLAGLTGWLLSHLAAPSHPARP